MKGRYHIRVENDRIRYDFEVKRNITVIQGDSATGKTNLVELISAYYNDREKSGISITCERECVVIGGRDWEVMLRSMSEKIIFIDEGNSFVKSDLFGRYVGESDNYFVIVTREGLPNLSYSVDEIYGIRQSSKYAGLKKTYNEMFKIYASIKHAVNSEINTVIVEDTNSGYEFFDSIVRDEINCESAGGKSRIKKILRNNKEDTIVVIADGAAYGSEMRETIEQIRIHGNRTILYLPESFEWLLLESDILDDPEVREILTRPEEYIDSKEYASWERYFTALLRKKTEGTYLQYNKSGLNPSYLRDREKTKILDKLPEELNTIF